MNTNVSARDCIRVVESNASSTFGQLLRNVRDGKVKVKEAGYSADQPRDNHGRWTAGSADFAALAQSATHLGSAAAHAAHEIGSGIAHIADRTAHMIGIKDVFPLHPGDEETQIANSHIPVAGTLNVDKLGKGIANAADRAANMLGIKDVMPNHPDDFQKNEHYAYARGQMDPKAFGVKRRTKESQRVRLKSNERITIYPQLRESQAAFNPGQRTFDVVIITDGPGNSDDGHFYFPETVAQAVGDRVFDGAQAFIDHPTLDEDVIRPERSLRDLVGYYFDSKLVESNGGGTSYAAKLRIFDGEAYDWVVSLLRETIKHKKMFPGKPPLSGISINADGDVAPETINGQTVKGVRKITKPFSADLVTKPARGGEIVALRESVRGSRSTQPNGEEGVSKLLEAAKRVEEQIASGEIDKNDLASLITTIRESEKPAEGSKQLREAAKTDSKDDGDGDDDSAESGNMQESESMMESGRKTPPELQGALKESDRSLSVDQIKKQFPGVYQAVLKEAQRNVSSDMEALRNENAELKTTATLRESTDRATRKLKESGLPTAAAQRLMHQLVGKDEAEQDRLIESEVNYHRELGFGANRKVEGAGANASVTLRESEGRVNASVLLAGMGDE